MRAAVMEATRKPLVVREVADPSPAPNGAVIRVEANGICRSDWHLWTGDWTWLGIAPQFPHVGGHEFCGVIEKVTLEETSTVLESMDRFANVGVTVIDRS